MVVSAQLTGIDHRHARHDIAESLEQGHGIAHALLLRSVPTILVVVGDEIHPDSFMPDGSVCFSEIIPQVLYGILTLRHTIHQMMQCPAVVHVKSRFGQFICFVLIFGKREHIRMRLTQIRHRPVPEVRRHLSRYVATESVYADGVHPPMHGFKHFITHVLVLIVQFGDIRPVVLYHQVAQAVAVVPAVVLGPFAIRSCVVSYPIEDDLETLFMRCLEEMLEIGARTELRIDSAVIDDGIVTAECSFASYLTDRLARHDPDDVNAVLLERRQQSLGSGKRTFRRRLAGV